MFEFVHPTGCSHDVLVALVMKGLLFRAKGGGRGGSFFCFPRIEKV